MSKRKSDAKKWEALGLNPPPKRPARQPQPADPVRLHAEQEQIRSNCVRTLTAALSTVSSPSEPPSSAAEQEGGASGDAAEALHPAGVGGLAAEVEQQLFATNNSSTGQEYKTAARALLAALKRNADLRRRVLTGALPPRQLVLLDARGLATSSQQAEYTRLQELETKRVTLAGAGAAVPTNDYTCKRCGCRNCDYVDTGRRDIGKCETWGSKDSQGFSRLVRCLGCGHRMEVDDV